MNFEDVFIFEELMDRTRGRDRGRPGGAGGPTVLFIGNNPLPTANDDGGVWLHLRSLFGAANVTYVQGSASVTGDMVGKSLGIISSTVSSSSVRGKFDALSVPQMTWEEAIYKTASGDYCMGSGSAKPAGVTDINVVLDTHPIMVAAGLSNGVVTIGGSATRACVTGTIPAGTSPLAEEVGTPGTKMLVACESGQANQCSGNFPGRRANFPIENTGFNSLNAAGINLFNATLDWLLGII